jgi:hypothetical protein
VAIAAIVIIGAVVATRLVGPTATTGASSSPAAAAHSAAVAAATTGTPHVTATPAPTNAPTPTPGASGATFTTTGVAANWKSFTWTQLAAESPLATADPGAQILQWSGGFVAFGTMNHGAAAFVWTSTDGQTWTVATSIVARRVMVAISPAGLVVIGGDPTQAAASQTVWTTSDGTHWTDAGSPTGLSSLDSIAGTSSGLVAVEHSISGSGKSQTTQYGVASSSDGIAWSAVAGAPDLSAGVIVPRVQSGSERFFLLGAPTALSGKGSQGELWWSDNGKSWTGAQIGWFGTGIDFGRDGMLLHTSTMTVGGGGTGMDVSTDGGKTWQTDNAFGPLGATKCGTGECQVGPDGVISSNGTTFLAVKSDGNAWTSYDGRTWTAIAWKGPIVGAGLMLVMPRGVVVGNSDGAAR